MSRPAGEFNAERYFRGDHGLRFYNVGTRRVRVLARDIHTATRERWSAVDALRFAGVLMRDPFLETKLIGIEVLARHRRSFMPAVLPEAKRWLAANLSANWATTDAICGMVLGPLLADRPELLPRLRSWARDHNMWVRRASVVALIPPMRHGLAIDQAYDTARALHTDREDLIQKAVGWTLREAGKRDPARLERYLRAHGASIPRTTLRYAIERFPEPKRRALLATTRSVSRAGSA